MDVDRKSVFKGRGAVGNQEGRFESERVVPFDDGWGTLEREPGQAPKTHFLDASARSIVTRNASPDIPFEQSVNPYQGCEHGCIYCYARQSHAYLGLSAGLDFETKIYVKHNAPELLEATLRKKSYRAKVITLGANTDPYQPHERKTGLTRRILEVLSAFQHPVAIITKSALVARDIDILAPMAARGLAKVFVSVTTLDNHLHGILEPRAAAPARRLQTVKALAEAGIPSGVMAAPMIPAINDRELEAILTAASEVGALSAGYIMLRLPFEVKDLFRDWLTTHFPDRAEHVMSLIHQVRHGKDNVSRFGERMRGDGPYAKLLSQRFKVVCRKLGLNVKSMPLDESLFKPPAREGEQLELF